MSKKNVKNTKNYQELVFNAISKLFILKFINVIMTIKPIGRNTLDSAGSLGSLGSTGVGGGGGGVHHGGVAGRGRNVLQGR